MKENTNETLDYTSATMHGIEKTDAAEQASREKVGSRLRMAREKVGMSQEELAHKLGYKHKSSINKVEIGEYRLRLDKASEIASILGVSVEYLMGISDDSTVSYPITQEEPLFDIIVHVSDEKKKMIADYTEALMDLSEEQQEKVHAFFLSFLELPEQQQNSLMEICRTALEFAAHK